MQETYVGSETIAPGKTIPLGEIGQHKAIEQVSDSLDIELEAFMNEPVKIMVHPSVVDGDLEVQTPTVNGVNQPIIRGMEAWVKRKYVEALARCRTTRYDQSIDPLDRSNIKMVEKTVVTYPFSILEDKNPKGAAWIRGILAER